jgi:hypothetical protein
MAARGSRYFKIGGHLRLLDFWERHVGPTARTSALQQTSRLRADGYFVRIVKVGRIRPDYCVYRLKNEDSR